MSRNNKGFTLIELLVVIAIIGILASVVLASLNTARAKAVDSAVKADVSQIRSQAAIDSSDSGVLPTTWCSAAGTKVDSLLDHVDLIAGNGATGSASKCYQNTADYSQWIAIGMLKTNTSKGWCVDHNGASKESTYASVNSAVFTCPN